jgi:AraC family transcriptional regulator, transcriptional activator of pobA
MEDQFFDNFDAYYKAGKGNIRSKHPDFHIFRFEDLGDGLVEEMGPFRTNYYQFAIGSEVEADITIFNQKVHSLESKIVIFVPGQLISWKKTGNWSGYVINVKESFLKFLSASASKRRYGFLLTENPCILDISYKQYEELAGIYEKILSEYSHISGDSLLVIENYMQILLIYIKRIYEKEDSRAQATTLSGDFVNPAFLLVASKFKELVLLHYLEKKAVGAYADMLFVTPKYLNDCVKISFGKSPKEMINEVLLLDAKTMLANQTTGIKEIADRLNFEDYAHFVKFFKMQTGLSPAQFRKGLS